MKQPRGGASPPGTTAGRPIMVLLDLLGRRKALRILWELSERTHLFRALVDAAETNPAVLNTRLRELRDAGLVSHDRSGYGLTDDGRSLVALFLPLVRWSEAWARAIAR